ncbi:MAG: STAS domain-containing protein [Burkholderiaceae bacterium]
MKLKFENLNPTDGVIVTVDDENLDAGNAREFKIQIQQQLDQHQLAILDMSTLNFVDSSGLGALLSCLRSMNNKQGQFKLIGLSRPVRALFELVRMQRIFSIYNNREEALASLL